MIVTYNNDLIEIENNYIRHRNYIINVNKVEANRIINILLFKFELNNAKKVTINLKPKKYTKAETLVLLAIGINHYHVYCYREKKNYEITFSYNFPIILEPELIDAFLTNIDEIVDAQLIALGENGDFLCVDVSDKEKFSAFKKRVDYIVRRNDKIFDISYEYSLESVLNRWQKYCKRKFDVLYSKAVLETYKKIYSQTGFSTITYLCNNDIVAQGVIFASERSKTTYYCIFAWEESYKSKSPGIYAYCKTIYKCFKEGYKFSFCYGSQTYKYNLIREFL